jgi:hypothetical protein
MRLGMTSQQRAALSIDEDRAGPAVDNEVLVAGRPAAP